MAIYIYLDGFTLAQATNVTADDAIFVNDLASATHVIYSVDPDRTIRRLPGRMKAKALKNMRAGYTSR